MPPRRYPNFQKTPRSFQEKLEINRISFYSEMSYPATERYDYSSGGLDAPKPRQKRYQWKNRHDYLFVIAFGTVSLYDVFKIIAAGLAFGGYVILLYGLITLSLTLTLNYLLVFLTVYTKKSILHLDRMLPVFTGFAYLMILFSLVRVVAHMHILVHFIFFGYLAITENFFSCGNEDISYLNITNVRCLSHQSPEYNKIVSPQCHSKIGSMILFCGDENILLSIFRLANDMFFNIRRRYIITLIAVCLYIVIVWILSKKDTTNFVKLFQAATIVFLVFQLLLIFTSAFFEGHQIGLVHFFQIGNSKTTVLNINRCPSKKQFEGAFLACALSFPDLAEFFLIICAATGRLPLCTVPAIDCVIISLTHLFTTIIFCISNLMIAGVLAKAFDISIQSIGTEFVPFTTASYFMALMPINQNFWIILYISLHSIFSFFKLLILLDSISANIVWYHGSSNKFIYFIFPVFMIFVTIYFNVLPDEDDINGWILQSVSINLPVITIFTFGLVIYGVNKLEEDISFMSSSPPAELVSRVIKFIPIICMGFVFWAKVNFLCHTLETYIMYLIFGIVIGEILVRLLLSESSESQITSKLSYGPPNYMLKAERKEFRLEKRHVAISNANRAVYLFNKYSSVDAGENENKESRK